MTDQAFASPADPAAAAAEANRMIDEGRAGTMLPALGLEYIEVGPDRMVARVPVQRNTQPYGLLHGGATAALIETLGSFGTAIAVGADRIVTGIELNVNHLKSVREGHITGTATPLHVGRTTAVWEAKVRDDEGRLVAAGRLTLVIREPSP